MNINFIYKKIISQKHYTFDSREVAEGSVFFAIKGKHVDGNKFSKQAIENGAAFVIIDNKQFYKNDDRYILVENVTSTLQELALKHRSQLSLPIIGITGSNGKTTMKEMIAHLTNTSFNIFKTPKNYNSKLGLPLSILMIQKQHNLAILEMGAGEKSDIKNLCKIAQPNYGVITSIAEAHIETFGSLQNIISTKMELFDYLYENNGVLFINKTDPLILKESKKYTKIKKILYPNDSYRIISNNENFFFRIKNKKEKKEYQTKIIGKHNFINILGALEIAQKLGIKKEEIMKKISSFEMIPGRLELWENKKRKNNILWDTYNANKASMTAGIKTLSKSKRKKILILGDMKELGKYSEQQHQEVLEQAQKCGDKIILIGSEFNKFKKTHKSPNTFFYENITIFKKEYSKIQETNTSFLLKSSFGTGLYNERIFFEKLFEIKK